VEHEFERIGRQTMLLNGRRLVQANTRTELILLAIEDITDRKRVQEALHGFNVLEQRVAERTSELRASVKEKEILLRELNHRVKNNLQVVASLLNLQAHRLPDPSARELLIDTHHRVRSIALVHEKLYQSKDLSELNFDHYVHTLVDNLFHAQNAVERGITSAIDAGGIRLSVSTAIPCGLIINELVTNSLKHAFPERRSGSVHIRLQERERKSVELLVEDDGIGLPADLDPRKTASLGLGLVFMLAEQLEAEVEVRRDQGTAFRIQFHLG
jgi:two-component sensor histidine kinase